MHKPSWLNKKINLADCRKLKSSLRLQGLNTVCEQALCPNISECFSKKVATFMILGNVCTRNCSFCSIRKGVPWAVDLEEPIKIAHAVKEFGLNYTVITSPTRDDLVDGGAQIFVDTVQAIQKETNSKVEILIPDFKAKEESLAKAAASGAQVISHNLETVPSLYKNIRAQASYQRSLKVIRAIKVMNNSIYLKSGIMLGLGEKEDEVLGLFKDLLASGCDFLTIGQYLAPSEAHYPVKEYVPPKKFDSLAEIALSLGFKQVKSSPYTRSSYLANETIVFLELTRAR